MNIDDISIYIVAQKSGAPLRLLLLYINNILFVPYDSK